MRKLWMVFLLIIPSVSFADMFEQGAVGFTGDTRQVVVSSNTAAPTQILTRDSYIRRTWITNTSSFTVLLSSVSTGFNSNTTYALAPCVTADSCAPWSPDGPNVVYWGPMFAVQLGTSVTTSNTISVMRTK